MRFLMPLILLTASCSSLSSSQKISAEDLSHVHSIAVFSDMGDDLNFGYSTGTAFGTGSIKMNEGAWGIDTYAEQVLVQSLKNNPQFATVSAFKDSTPRPFVKDVSDREAFLTRAKNQGFDAVIFFRPTPNDGVPQLRPGYGLFKNRADQELVDHYVYVLGTLAVYETTHHKLLNWTWTYNYKTYKPGIVSDTPVRWRNHFEDYSADEKIFIQKLLKEQIKIDLAYALAALDLAPSR
jgi:hypothetical protein